MITLEGSYEKKKRFDCLAFKNGSRRSEIRIVQLEWMEFVSSRRLSIDANAQLNPISLRVRAIECLRWVFLTIVSIQT